MGTWRCLAPFVFRGQMFGPGDVIDDRNPDLLGFLPTRELEPLDQESKEKFWKLSVAKIGGPHASFGYYGNSLIAPPQAYWKPSSNGNDFVINGDTTFGARGRSQVGIQTAAWANAGAVNQTAKSGSVAITAERNIWTVVATSLVTLLAPGAPADLQSVEVINGTSTDGIGPFLFNATGLQFSLALGGSVEFAYQASQRLWTRIR